MTASPAVLAALRDRLARIVAIKHIVATRFNINPEHRACLRRDAVVAAVADALSSATRRIVIAAPLRRDVREAVEWMGAIACRPNNRALFRGIKPKELSWRQAERKYRALRG